MKRPTFAAAHTALLGSLVLFGVITGGIAGCAEDTLTTRPISPLGRGGVEGRLCNRATGLWVANATVSVDGSPQYSTESDADGYFTLDNVPGGEYVLVVEAEDYIDQRSAVVADGVTTTIGGTECRPETGNLIGRICDDDNEQWARGAGVSVTTVHGEQTAETDDFGRFSIAEVPVGGHELVATVDEVTKRYDFVLGTAEELFVGDLGCGPMGAIQGRICGGDGFWLANAVVFVETADGTLVQTITDPEGNFVLQGVPAGVQTVQVTRGSFSTSFAVEVPGNELVVIEEPVCIPPTTAIAVITGSYDSVQDVLANIGFPERARFSGAIATEIVTNADGNVDVITGSAASWMGHFLGDPLWMAQYDIIFFNCGLNDAGLLTSTGNVTTYLANLQQFVYDGGSVYASDWANEIIRLAFPNRINFYGNDALAKQAQVGAANTGLQATIMDQGLATALARTNIVISMNLAAWVVMENLDSQPATLRTMVRGNVGLISGQNHANAPLLSVFEHGAGRVLYTSFHNRSQTTQDMDDVLNYIVFEL